MFKSVVVYYLSCVWLFWFLSGLLRVDVAVFTQDNLAILFWVLIRRLRNKGSQHNLNGLKIFFG